MGLIYEDRLDSDAQVIVVRNALLLDRGVAVHLGESAVRAIDDGFYVDESGSRVGWRAEVNAALRVRISVKPETPYRRPDATPGGCRLQVANETSLMAARRLADEGENPLVLNMANGVSPGGGFLHGARAQEESLCRSSALFATLVGDPMYDLHAARGEYESTSWTILSPRVPVFRLDDGTALATTWMCNFITCAAPVAQRVGQPRSGNLLQERIERVLDIAAAHGFRALVLGAWGCGAFGNDPVRTANDFHAALRVRSGHFDRVVFAITDWSPERRFLGPFRDEFHG